MKSGEVEKPDWIFPPMRAFYRWTNELRLLYEALLRGLSFVSSLPEMNEAFLSLSDSLQDMISPGGRFRDPEILKRDEALGDFVKSEIDEGFPRAHAHLLVSYWGALEAYITDTLITWMENKPECLGAQEIERIKIRLVEFNRLSEEERLSYILSSLRNEIGTTYKIGVGQFESLLRIVGLRGEVEESMKRDLLELSELRHVIVHRRMVADEKLRSNCPWLGYEVGDFVVINQSQFYRLVGSTINYAISILRRLHESLDLPWD
jgi:hypothetical protein